MDDAFKALDVNGTPPGVKDALEEFASSIVAFRDTVLRDILQHAVSDTGGSGTISRPTEWGSKKSWQKVTPSVGSSNRISVLAEEVVMGVVQQFADEDSGAEKTAVSATPSNIKKKKIGKRPGKQQTKPATKQQALDPNSEVYVKVKSRLTNA